MTQELTPNRRLRIKPISASTLAGILMLALVCPAWAAGNKTGWKDGGVNTAVLKDLAIALRNEKVEFVVDVGDLIAKFDSKLLTGTLPDGTKITADKLIASELNLFTTTWNTWSGGLPIYPVRGNHEASASAATYLAGIAALPGIGEMLPNTFSPSDGDKGLTYAFAEKNCIFIGLDVYMNPAVTPAIPPSTLAWLNGLLAEKPERHVFVWGHTPAYEIWDSEKAPLTAARDGLASPKLTPAPPVPPLVNCAAAANVRDPFWNILGNANASYFCGHDHIYLRGSAPSADGTAVMQTIIGNGGAPAYPPYPVDPFVESAAYGVPNCGSPRPTSIVFDQSGSLGQDSYGYVLVEIHGSHATATYKAENKIGGTFEVRDQWTWKIRGNE